MFLLVSAISTILVVSFCVYVITILIPFLRRRRQPAGDPTVFGWHFFVPCRDEEAVIAETIERLRGDFPDAHVWVIDDDSDDATAAIVSEAASTDDHVHLVQRRRPHARTGKGDALNAAYAHLDAFLPADADRSAIVVTVIDADGHLAPNALAQVAGDDVFGNPKVGAAQVTVRMRNRNDRAPYPHRGRLVNAAARFLIRMQDIEFRTMIAAMQSLRERTGTVGLGGNGQFTRLSTLDAIKESYGQPWHGSLLEDYELGVHVLLAGYENRHVHDTYVSQEALPNFRRFATQRTRWSQGNIQCVRYVRDIVVSPHISSAGVLESSYYLILPFIQLIGFFTWIYLTVTGFASFLNGTTTALFTDNWGLAILFALFGVGPFFLWGPVYRKTCEPDAPLWKGVLWGLGMWLYVFYLYVSLSRAFFRVITGKKGWAKTRRNAETIRIGVVAKEC
ncbi:multidrug transporter [Leifsonia xyli]|uniref:glycosyltransferase family 2 protein n=1 Tax=Leifsonia xyli TaxID=1575 RepID=UPI0007CDF4A1|nr:multidrug transporter [Leifsonia xyli]